MFTWKEIRSYIREHYRPTFESDTSLSLQCEYPEGGRQAVLVSLRNDRLDGAAVEIAAPVGDAQSLAPMDALAYNHSAPAGTLALVGKVFVLRHFVEVERATFAAIDRALSYVAGEAMRLRRSTQRAPVPAEVFWHLAT